MLAGVWQKLKVERVVGANAAAFAAEWRALAGRAQEPCGFQGANFALPILAQTQAAALDLVRRDGQLLMAAPIAVSHGFDISLPSDLTASGLPEVDGPMAPETVLAFLNGRTRPVLFKSLPARSLFHNQLQALAPRIQVMARWHRAALQLDGTFEGWMAQNFDHKRRKELKRLRSRLAEQGALKFETLSQSKDLQRFADGLLDLEAKGWKGARGTALQADVAKTAAFRQVCENLHRSGSLRFWQLTFNGQPIASLFGMVEGEQGWIVKIAHDEAFAKFSPGVLLIIEATQALFAEGGVKLMDSCAIPGHPMIDRIWRDRIEMVDVLVAPTRVSALQFNLVKAGLAVHAALRARAKSALHVMTKRKKS
jgi:CelD/BcsL family acetyltransferase involved in cellulose biosynthesis